MQELNLGLVETQFADIVWSNAPVTTKKLVELCETALGWKRTTTYTVLKKLCNKGIFKTEDSIVSVLIPKAEFAAIRSEQFVEKSYGGSLPAFIAAFTSRNKLSAKELDEIHKLIDAIGEKK